MLNAVATNLTLKLQKKLENTKFSKNHLNSLFSVTPAFLSSVINCMSQSKILHIPLCDALCDYIFQSVRNFNSSSLIKLITRLRSIGCIKHPSIHNSVKILHSNFQSKSFRHLSKKTEENIINSANFVEFNSEENSDDFFSFSEFTEQLDCLYLASQNKV